MECCRWEEDGGDRAEQTRKVQRPAKHMACGFGSILKSGITARVDLVDAL
jgi:hypothetical protein